MVSVTGDERGQMIVLTGFIVSLIILLLAGGLYSTHTPHLEDVELDDAGYIFTDVKRQYGFVIDDIYPGTWDEMDEYEQQMVTYCTIHGYSLVFVHGTLDDTSATVTFIFSDGRSRYEETVTYSF